MAETKTPGGVRTEELIYALDVGTRSVIGMVGRAENGRVRVLAVEKEPHPRRAMLDGQIEDIAQVAQVVEQVTRRLEERMGLKLERACVAAAGRALRWSCPRPESWGRSSWAAWRRRRCPTPSSTSGRGSTGSSASSWWAIPSPGACWTVTP